MEYVFPALPVVSRSQLVRSTLSPSLSQSQNLDITPPYLLAAIYASALEFGSYDDVLCLSDLYQKPSAERLWQMVYDGIQSQLHAPRLATVSAALLYLNKPRIGVQHIAIDTPFTWAFTASTVALVTSLGLHMDCTSWSIPDWEKRLRRRLWWTSFSEEKWRSLLLGRPSIIARDQWSVSKLTNQDFEIDQTNEIEPQQQLSTEVETFLRLLRSSGKDPEKALLSQQITTLALIADDVYITL
jgi:Fungal specific transcription factor domain